MSMVGFGLRLTVIYHQTVVISVLPALLLAQFAHAETLRRLTADEIRERLGGRDLTDGGHWSEHYRRDGTLSTHDMGHSRTGRWAIQGNQLCTAHEPAAALDCYQIWNTDRDLRLPYRDTDPMIEVNIVPHSTR